MPSASTAHRDRPEEDNPEGDGACEVGRARTRAPYPLASGLSMNSRIEAGTVQGAIYHATQDLGDEVPNKKDEQRADEVRQECDELSESVLQAVARVEIGKTHVRLVPWGLGEGETNMRSTSKKYEIHSGRRLVSTQFSVSPLQAVVDYVRAYGVKDAEITRLGVDCVSWRGAQFRAVLVPTESP